MYKSDSNCDLLLSFDSSPFGSVDELSDVYQEPQTYTYELIQPYHFVLYLSDASKNEENGRMKGENSDQTLFSLPQIFFYPLKDKTQSFQRQYVGFFKKEARRGQHHYFQIVYGLKVLIDPYSCKRTRSILY